MDEFVIPRTLAKGRSYVYMLPCRDQDLLKIGFSREPLERFRTLHRRFFEYFDLDRGLLVEVDRVAQARAIERDILQRHAEDRSPAPLVIADRAAGYSEWLRGVEPAVSARLREFAVGEGYRLYDMRAWLRQMLEAQSDRLYDWSLRMLDAVEYEAFNIPEEMNSHQAERALAYAMDACEAAGIVLAEVFPEKAMAWRARRR